MPDDLRGRTFSPAEKWHEGSAGAQRAFAIGKVVEVAALIRELTDEQKRVNDRLPRLTILRCDRQREYDLEDATRTLLDAVSTLRRADHDLEREIYQRATQELGGPTSPPRWQASVPSTGRRRRDST